MNRKNNIIRTILIIITVLLIAITGFSQANESNTKSSGYQDNYSPTGDRTYIRLKQTAENKVDVYLELADTTLAEDQDETDGISVASFTIGLDIGIDLEDQGSVVDFEFSPKLKDETYCKLMKAVPVDEKNQEGIKIGEQLNIYYVGTKELNDPDIIEEIVPDAYKNNEDNIKPSKCIKVGTITVKNIKEVETMSITPDSGFTSVATIGHAETKISILPEDKLEMIIGNTGENESGNDKDNTIDNNTVEDNKVEDNTTTEEPSGDNDGKDEDVTNPDDKGKPEKEDENSKGPSTGDITIGVFVVLMVVSLIGIVFTLKRKNKTKRRFK